jgi:transcription elongation GreA/GreB family factor
MDKRSLLARIVKNYPAIQSLITGEAPRQDANLIVSWESLERRKDEYQELVHKKIPANSKEIAIARSYGDLSENHEYKAAKEMQKLLMQRKAELESQLLRARGTDFGNARTDVVSAGTIVQATDLESTQSEQFTILGAWDFDAEKNVISYLSPVGQSLLGHKVGDVVEFEAHGVQHRHRIDQIVPYKAASAPAATVPAPAATASPVSASAMAAGSSSETSPAASV